MRDRPRPSKRWPQLAFGLLAWPPASRLTVEVGDEQLLPMPVRLGLPGAGPIAANHQRLLPAQTTQAGGVDRDHAAAAAAIRSRKRSLMPLVAATAQPPVVAGDAPGQAVRTGADQ